MKKTFKICILLLICFGIVFIGKQVNAATADITIDKSEITVGDTVTATVKYTAASWDLSVSADSGLSTTNTTQYANTTETAENETKSFTVTYTASKEGKLYIRLTGNITDESSKTALEVSETREVTVKPKETDEKKEPTENQEKPEEPKETTKEEQKPTEPTFTNVNKTMYVTGSPYTNLRASWSTSSAATKIKEGTEVTVTGTSTETINGYVWYRVSYEGQTKYVAKKLLTETKPEVEKSTVKTLKELKIEEGALDPEFSADVTRYTLQVGNNIEKLNITATPTDEKAKVTITGNEELKTGSNAVKITVTAEDGTARIYNIDVQKDEQDALALTKLEIPGVTLSPSFNPSIYEYSVDIDINSNISDLSIQSEANRENSTIEVIGNENFKEGENVVKILITSEDGKDKVSYQIIVNKVAMVEQETNLPVATSTNKTMYLYIAIGGLIVIAIIIIIIAIIKKLREDDDDEFTSFTPKGTGDFGGDIDDADDLDNTDDRQQIYKSQILREEQEKNSNKLFDYDEEDRKYDESKFDNKESGRNSSFESKNMDSTRRYSTNYDYTLEDFRKPKNPRGGRGKHF